MTVQSKTKYKAIYEVLQQRLCEGYYSVGARLPTEDSLAKTFKASRVTVRRALEMLVNEGFLTARQGSGYIVQTLSPPSHMCLASFTDSVLQAGREPGAVLIEIKTFEGDAPPEIRDIINEPVTCIVRLRTVDGDPEMLEQTWIPTRLLPDISAADFPERGQGQSILRIMRQRFGLDWCSACETIGSSTTPPEIAKLLNVGPNVPIVKQACVAYDCDEKVVFFDETYRNSPITYRLSGVDRQSVVSQRK